MPVYIRDKHDQYIVHTGDGAVILFSPLSVISNCGRGDFDSLADVSPRSLLADRTVRPNLLTLPVSLLLSSASLSDGMSISRETSSASSKMYDVHTQKEH